MPRAAARDPTYRRRRMTPDLWLADASEPSMHQTSREPQLTEASIGLVKPLRRTIKVTDGDGLDLMVVPTGGRSWRYNYRFEGKQKTLALGIYPDVPLEWARARHQAARRLLAAGVDPSTHRKELRRTAIR